MGSSPKDYQEHSATVEGDGRPSCGTQSGPPLRGASGTLKGKKLSMGEDGGRAGGSDGRPTITPGTP